MKVIRANDKFLGFKARSQKGLQRRGLGGSNGYINCTISSVVRVFSTSDSGVKSSTPIARSNKNRAMKNPTDRFKDMRKDDIVTEKDTTLRTDRDITASNNRRSGGIDEFIITEMRTTGKLKQNIKK